jgi:MoaD family protein
MKMKEKLIHVQYFAVLREECGQNAEVVRTKAATACDLYEDLCRKYGFRLTSDALRVCINDEFCAWKTHLKTGDNVVFIPPVGGG